MDLLTLILIAFGLAMDCFAVSVANGMTLCKINWRQLWKMAFLFGLFQSIMPVAGWLAGISFRASIEQWDHWMALIILSILGIKMMYEGLVDHGENVMGTNLETGWKSLMFLAIATSIDALAAGLVFVSFSEIFFKAVAIIGLVSFIFTIAGNYIGFYCGKKFNFKPEILGGLILIIIGLKIFVEHMIYV
jgi:putative Mn2+ efflux pump MntP